MSSSGRGSGSTLRAFAESSARASAHTIGQHDDPMDTDDTATTAPTPSSTSRAPRAREVLQYDESGRGIVSIYMGCLRPSGSISTSITKAFKRYRMIEGYNWKLVPEEMKTCYWEEFKKEWVWPPTLSDASVREKWFEKASFRYKDLVCTLKKKRKRPPYIPEEAWPGWLAYWEREDVMEKAAIARRNRMSEPDGPGTGISKHRGGSKAAVEYVVEFENASEHPDSIERALFSQFHKNDAGEYTDERSRRIDEEWRARIEQLSQPVPGTDDVPEVDTSQVFLDVAGAPKKKRLFGTGCLGRMLMRSASSSAPPPSPAASSVDAETIARLERQIAEDRTAREAMAATLMRQQEMLSQLLERMGGAPPPPPPPDSAA